MIRLQLVLIIISSAIYAGMSPSFEYLTSDKIVAVTDGANWDSNTTALQMVNGSGMDYSTWMHEANGSSLGMWAAYIPSAADVPNPVPGIPDDGFSAWACIEFDQVYQLSTMWVWNFNQHPSLADRCMKDVWIDYSEDGAAWSRLWNGNVDYFTLTQAPGTGPIEHTDEIEFNGVSAKFVIITAKPVPDGTYGGNYITGLSEILFGIESDSGPVDAIMPVFMRSYPETLNLPEYSGCIAVYDSEIQSFPVEVIARQLHYDVSGLGNDPDESFYFLARSADTAEDLEHSAFTPVFQADPYVMLDRRGRFFQLRLYVFGGNPADPPVISNIGYNIYMPDDSWESSNPPQTSLPQIRGPEILVNSGFETPVPFVPSRAAGWTPIYNRKSGINATVERVLDPTAPEGNYTLKCYADGETYTDVTEVGASAVFNMNGEKAAVVTFWIKAENVGGTWANAYSGARVNYYVTGTDGSVTNVLNGFNQGFGTEWDGTTKDFNWIKIKNFVNPGKPIQSIRVVPCIYQIGHGTVWFDDIRLEPVLDYGHDDEGASLYATNDGDFPIGIYLLDFSDAGPQSYIPMLAELGFNMTIWRTGYQNKFEISMLDYIHQHGMKEITRVCDGTSQMTNLTLQFDRHPACWGYYTKDEPGGSRYMPYSLNDIKKTNTYLNMLGVTKPRVIIADEQYSALNYLDTIDYLGRDIYTTPQQIARDIIETNIICGPKSNFFVPMTYYDTFVDQFGNPDGHKAAVFGAIINGTRGVAGFRFRGPGFENYLKAVERLHYLSGVLVNNCQADITVSANGGSFMAKGFLHDRNADGNPELYLMLAEVANLTVSGTVTLNDLPGDMNHYSVFGEASVTRNGNSLNVTLSPFGTDVIRFVSPGDDALNKNGSEMNNLLKTLLYADRWLNSCEAPSWCNGFDFDKNGHVNLFDLISF
jgi:hypothetical protein